MQRKVLVIQNFKSMCQKLRRMLNTIKTLNIMTSLNTIKRKIKRFVILLLYCFSSIYAQSENIENSIWISSDSLIFFEYWEINEEPSRKVKIS